MLQAADYRGIGGGKVSGYLEGFECIHLDELA